MSTFQTASAVLQPLDPLKRVNYTFGLVLGVEEFQQEQTYFLSKDRSHNRILHGYGTAYGLGVSIDNGGTPNVEVRVACGMAVNPKGQEIHVPRTMCARLNDWLSQYQSALQEIYGPPPLTLSMCVVLCYHECQTDEVPVPGEPCRTQEDAMAASHIADSFELKLCLDTDVLPVSPPVSLASLPSGLCLRPKQDEEEAVRAFRQLLNRLQVSTTAPLAGYLTLDQLDALVLQLSSAATSTSPPSSGPPLWVHPADVSDFVRRAYLVWVTQVRPALNASLPLGACCSPQENCVLLARLSFGIGMNWMVLGDVTIDETDRPFLVQTRLLQEAILLDMVGSSGGGGGQSMVVAAGTFQYNAGSVNAVGPTLNGLTATRVSVSPATFLLNWAGAQPYANPLASPPGGFTYVVKGTSFKGPGGRQQVFDVTDFQDGGILVRVSPPVPPPLSEGGFMVEISEIRSGM
jgi:hypothetical protein